jgi:hypothetical protein
MNEVIFIINEKEKIVLKLQNSLDKVDCCSDGLVALVQQQQMSLLSNDVVLENIRTFAFLLQKALDNSLSLDLSIANDIGFIYNEYCNFLWSKDRLLSDNQFVYKNFDKNKNWIGMRHHLWAGEDNVTWLYSDKNGSIILEVTPLYPYLHANPNEESHYVFYEEWIRNYKPYCMIIISRENALEWLLQATKIIEQIGANTIRLKKEYDDKKKNE